MLPFLILCFVVWAVPSGAAFACDYYERLTDERD